MAPAPVHTAPIRIAAWFRARLARRVPPTLAPRYDVQLSRPNGDLFETLAVMPAPGDKLRSAPLLYGSGVYHWTLLRNGRPIAGGECFLAVGDSLEWGLAR